MRAAVFPIITQAKNTVNDNFPPQAVLERGGTLYKENQGIAGTLATLHRWSEREMHKNASI